MKMRVNIFAKGHYILIISIILGISFSIYKAYCVDSSDRNFDLRWFFAAGACLAQDKSPYNFELFSQCWKSAFGDVRFGPFAFLPTIILFVLPISFLDWPSTQIFSIFFGVLSLLGLSLALLQLSCAHCSTVSSRVYASFAIFFALSMTGIPGSMFVGQPTVTVALGVSLLFIYLRCQRSSTLIAGLLLASIKLHLVLFLFIVSSIVAIRKTPIALFVAAAMGMVSILIIAGSPISFLGDYLNGQNVRLTTEVNQMYQPQVLVGITGLSHTEILTSHTTIISIIICGLVFFSLGCSEKSLDISIIELIGVVALLFSFLIFQLKIYDLAALVPIYSLSTRLSRRGFLVLGLPLLLVWRPQLLALALGDLVTAAQVATFMIIIMSCFFLGAIARAMRTEYYPAPK